MKPYFLSCSWCAREAPINADESSAGAAPKTEPTALRGVVGAGMESKRQVAMNK